MKFTTVWSSIVKFLFASNTRISKTLEGLLRIQNDKPFWDRFHEEVRWLVSQSSPGDLLVDLGGGQRCFWAPEVPENVDVAIVDIDVGELELNQTVASKHVADVSDHLPFADGSAALVVSRTLLEHVENVPTCVREIARILTPGGRTIHLVPSRYSLFATVARIGPFDFLRRLVHLAIPSSQGHVEFPVFYDHCYPRALEKLFCESGFKKVEISVCYAQTGYFYPVFPLYLIVALYQFTVRILGLKGTASYLIVSAAK